MPFTTHKITRFAKKISDLPDDPQIPAAELKARFDACPEELREAHNAVCDEAERLEARVSGIVAQTFGDAVAKTMLAPELAAEIDAKAAQTALDAEAAARESTDSALQTAVAQKCEAYFGTYTGNGAANRVIELGFRPKAAIILCPNSFFALKTQTYTCVQYTDVTATANATAENGLHVGTTEKDSRYSSSNTNMNGVTYEYIAFKA